MSDYKLYTKEPNTIAKGGRVFTKSFFFDTNNEFKNRLVRVYLPSSYDEKNPNKRFKTIYMLDGKNLFDDYTSFVGEWGIDETIEQFIKEGKDGYIVIGIDAPNKDIDRSLEMIPDELHVKKKYRYKGNGYGSKLGKFIFEVVKPDIDKTFHTLPEKEFTGVGGSSMGGLMSFYLGLEYKDRIAYCLNFSPAFFLFDQKVFKQYMEKHFSLDLPKMYFYVGGVGFEAVFINPTLKAYKFFIKNGYSHEDCKMIFDSNKEHNEQAWREYFPNMLAEIDKR